MSCRRCLDLGENLGPPDTSGWQRLVRDGGSLVLATAGGTAGVLLGVAITYGLARLRHWQPLIPSTAVGAALAAVLVIGAVAGLYPASRAARLSPTEALRTA
jgi:putative ABC transport system permease protein